MTLLLNLLGLCISIFLIFKSSDYFIDGAISLAKLCNIPYLIVGALILGFGTSAPEMLISASSSLKGLGGIAIGNVVGSNIVNVALVLGIAAAITPIKISKQTLLVETGAMLIASCIVVYMMASDNILTKVDGIILIVGLLAIIIISIKTNKVNVEDKSSALGVKKTVTYLVLGGFVLLSGVELLVWSASRIASFLGASDTLIGLTIVAFGSSLPELALTINACFKRQTDLIIGNIIGSNLFNLLAVLPFPALLTTYYIEPSLISFDLMLMLGLAFSIPLGVLLNYRSMSLGKVYGILAIFVYLSYIAFKVVETLS